jgi:hypothetical protein
MIDSGEEEEEAEAAVEEDAVSTEVIAMMEAAEAVDAAARVRIGPTTLQVAVP